MTMFDKKKSGPSKMVTITKMLCLVMFFFGTSGFLPLVLQFAGVGCPVAPGGRFWRVTPSRSASLRTCSVFGRVGRACKKKKPAKSKFRHKLKTQIINVFVFPPCPQRSKRQTLGSEARGGQRGPAQHQGEEAEGQERHHVVDADAARQHRPGRPNALRSPPGPGGPSGPGLTWHPSRLAGTDRASVLDREPFGPAAGEW